MLKILGMNEFFYVGETVIGHNCDFEELPFVTSRHEIYGVEEGKYYSISLAARDTICSSGWTVASEGSMLISKIDQLPSIGYKIKSDTWIEKPENDDPSVDNNVFQYSGDGGDEYYPCGGYIVNDVLFEPTARRISARPVWILSGDSGTGKSFLSSKLKDLAVYETDSNKELPEVIFADVIVVGNKYDHDHGEIVKRIFGEHKLITVNFGN